MNTFSTDIVHPSLRNSALLTSRVLNPFTLFVVVARCCWVFSLPLRTHGTPLGFAMDDFYYYLKCAQNLAYHHSATFDGTTLTNGFHPLYLLFLAAACLTTHSLRGIFVWLCILDVASATSVFVLSRMIFSRLAPHAVLSNALALAVMVSCFPLISNQMEVTLALPLGFAFLAAGFVSPRSYTPSRCALLGILGALTFLARLDAAILIALFLAGLVMVKGFRPVFTWKNAFSFAAAALPLPLIYLLVNERVFHVLLPISGMAKELKQGAGVSYYLVGSFGELEKRLLKLAIATGIVGWVLRRKFMPEEKVFLFAVLATPFVFYGIEMLISDWPIWPWYFYPLRYSWAGTVLIVGILLSRDVVSSRYRTLQRIVGSPWCAPVLFLGALLVLLNSHYKVGFGMMGLQQDALTLNAFEQTHPGKYAMGDRAGMFGYITSASVLQAEGLMMDREYIDHIRTQDDLRRTLSRYGIKYYVAFTPAYRYDSGSPKSCFHAMEPWVAGPRTLRMRSDFCGAPVFQFAGADGEYLVYEINPA